MPKKTLLLVILLTLLLPVLAFGEEVNSFTLSNGLQVLHMEKRTTQTVTATILLKASALQEPQGKEGIANLTAKSILTGTKHRSNKRIIEDAANAGATVESNITPDYATLTLNVVRKETAYGFDILTDILVDPSFDDGSLLRQKNTAAEDQKRERQGFSCAEATIAADLFGKHPYGRSLYGTPESLASITRDDVVAFHKAWYTPKNAILVIVGAITLEEAKRIATPYMEEWKGESPQQPVHEKAPSPAKKVTVIQSGQPKASIALGFMGFTRDNPDYAAASVMNYILGGLGQASRLTKAFQGEESFYPVLSRLVSRKEGGYFVVGADVSPQDVSKVTAKIIAQVEGMKQSPATEDELKEAREFVKQSLTIQLGPNKAIAEFLGVTWLYNLGSDYTSRFGGIVDKVSGEDVLRVAKKYLDMGGSDLVILGNKAAMDLSGVENGKK